MAIIRYGAALLLIMLVVVTGATRGQAGPEPLFGATPAEWTPGRLGTPVEGQGHLRQRYVTVNTSPLQAAAGQQVSTLQIDLFDGMGHIVTGDRIESRAGGDVVWQGHVDGRPQETVTLVLHAGVVAGTIRADGRLYRLTYAGDGVHLLEEMAAVEPMAEHLPVAIDPTVQDEASGQESGSQLLSGDDGSVIDVLVVYTPASQVRYGGQEGIEALIELAVVETNTAYENSLINTRLSLVAMSEVSYGASAGMLEDLSRLRSKSDDYMDEVHEWRDAAAADTVTLIQEASDYCGIAYLMTALSHSFEVSAFSVVDSDCATGYYSFGHELGHNMGSAHDHANSYSGLYDYSFGYWAPDASFRTIMAYNCPSGCERIQYFSNPDVLYGNQPTGLAYSSNPAEAANNARSINETRVTVANWRDSATRMPAAPTGLYAIAQSPTRIELNWQDNAISEEGFDLQRRIAGQTWASIADLAANTVSYQDQGLVADTTYEYRIRSYAGQGLSTFSAAAGATTLRYPEVHAGGISGAGSIESGSGPDDYAWRATVTVVVHDAYHNPVSGATVSGQWSYGASGSATCVTGGSGACSVVKAALGPEIGSVAFSVSAISDSSDPYLPGHNHDVIGDGSTITVFKPVAAVYIPFVDRGQ